MKFKNQFLLITVIFSVTACSSINSTKIDSKDIPGLTYFMPKKDIKLTLVIESDKPPSMSIETTPAYPDLTQQYVLQYSTNLFGKNSLDVSVSESGLLQSSKSTTVSSVTTSLSGLASSIASVRQANTNKQAPDACSKAGTYVHLVAVTHNASKKENKFCGYLVSVKPISNRSKDKGKNKDNVKETTKGSDESYSGVFYRQSEAYIVEAKAVKGDRIFQGLVFSPSDSKIHFLPIKKTVFTNNEAEFTFKDGMLEGYKQSADAELVALLKLPADVLKSYFTAVGSVFTQFKSNDEGELNALNASLSLQLAKRKYEDCIEAINTNNQEMIVGLGCSAP